MNNATIFERIAEIAIANGYEVSLEQKNYEHNSSTFITKSEGTDTGLVLRRYPPQDDNDDAEDEEEIINEDNAIDADTAS